MWLPTCRKVLVFMKISDTPKSLPLEGKVSAKLTDEVGRGITFRYLLAAKAADIKQG